FSVGKKLRVTKRVAAPPKAAAPSAVGHRDWHEQKGRFTQEYRTARQIGSLPRGQPRSYLLMLIRVL
ncbi:MAG TPA: hypothetical protein VK555_09550, partial [Terriglobales bacterium]|nr:hypothetical protein [Terriglobales bacterium]